MIKTARLKTARVLAFAFCGLLFSGCTAIAPSFSSLIPNPSTAPTNPPGVVGVLTPASLSVTPSQYDFQTQSLNSLNYATFTVSNLGQSPATDLGASGLSGPYAFRGGTYPGTGGTCTTSLAAQSSCQIVIVFQPTELGALPLNTFYVVYDGADASTRIPVPLTGGATNIATLRFSDSVDDNLSWDFGTLAVGTTVTKTIELEYFGLLPATGLTFPALGGPFSILSNNCPD